MTSDAIHGKRNRSRQALSKVHIDRELLALRFYEIIPSTFDALDEVVDMLLILAREMNCNDKELEEVELAMREALANAVIHGNRQDPKKRVAVRAFCQP